MPPEAIPFLRLPPFPGHRATPLARALADAASVDANLADLADRLREAKVGSHFWLPPASLPEGRDVVLAPTDAAQIQSMERLALSDGLEDRAAWLVPDGWAVSSALPRLSWPVDPWSIASQASEVWTVPVHELSAVAQIMGTRLVHVEGAKSSPAGSNHYDLIRDLILAWDYSCPYSGSSISPAQAIDLLAEYRRLIISNRQFTAVFGVAGWKRPTVDPLLWDGGTGPRHARWLPAAETEKPRILAWKTRAPKALLDELENLDVAEIEDGMIRGPGLGANCVPPLSIIVDNSGIYFDPSKPSDLEQILQSAEIGPELAERAAQLREQIVEAGISKYGSAVMTGALPAAGQCRILVVGQVEDDRSIITGGQGQTNQELLTRARAMEPDAWIIYRPHPDVEAGHRKGHVPDPIALQNADEIDRRSAITSLIEGVDGVHCITSLAGFEALLRGKTVTTHGLPFYAGWGLTRDLTEIPHRRTRRRSLDELVAATLILYPRYLDPMTRLPCQPEILVERIARGEAVVAAPLSGLRKLQGKLNKAVRRLVEASA